MFAVIFTDNPFSETDRYSLTLNGVNMRFARRPAFAVSVKTNSSGNGLPL